MEKIYLASTSPRRKQLLEQIGLDFEIIPSIYEEDMTIGMPPEDLAKHLSKGKAHSAAKNISNGIIIAADTFIVFDGMIMGKPHDEKTAKETLQKISGNIVQVITGLTVLDTETDHEESLAEVTELHIADLDESLIDAYITTGEPLDKAGAFGIQGHGTLLIKKIEGDYNNVVGLPLFKLAHTLKKFNVNVFNN